MSKLCDQVVETIKQIFPQLRLRREECINFRGQKMYLDILIPQFGIIIEVNGRQHDQFVEHFHQTAEGFRAYKRRDRMKEEWAAENGYTFIVFGEDELPISQEKLLERIDAANSR